MHETADGESKPGRAADEEGGTAPATVSADDMQSLLRRLGSDAAVETEIETMVPMVIELLRRLLDAADDEIRSHHHELVEAVQAEESDSPHGDSLRS